MKSERQLYEHERYLRYNQSFPTQLIGNVNLAKRQATTKKHVLKPRFPDETYVIPSYNLTIVGKDLLKNYQQFGNSTGKLVLEYWSKDKLGILFDTLSMYNVLLGTSEDWRRGQKWHVHELEKLTEPGQPFDYGVLRPSYNRRLLTELAVQGFPTFISEMIPVSFGDNLVCVSWDVHDSFDKNGSIHNKYRIDIEYGTPVGTGVVSLTHWPSSPVPSPLPPPATVPLPMTAGYPIDEIFQKKSRDLMISSNFIRVIVYFDPSDPFAADISHIDNLLDRPPGFNHIGLYFKFSDRYVTATETNGNPTVYASDGGRRRIGEFSSFRDLIEFSSGINDASKEKAYNGKDIAILELPIYNQISGKWGGSFTGTFYGSGLSLLEIKANDGIVRFEEEE